MPKNIIYNDSATTKLDLYRPEHTFLTPAAGLYLDHDATPASGSLNNEPILIDGDYSTSVTTCSPLSDCSPTDWSAGVDLGTAETVTRLIIYDDGEAGSGISWVGYNDTYAVYSSNDGTNWELVADYYNIRRLPEYDYVSPIPSPVPTRYKTVIDIEQSPSPVSPLALYTARYWKVYCKNGGVAASDGTKIDPCQIEAYTDTPLAQIITKTTPTYNTTINETDAYVNSKIIKQMLYRYKIGDEKLRFRCLASVGLNVDSAIIRLTFDNYAYTEVEITSIQETEVELEFDLVADIGSSPASPTLAEGEVYDVTVSAIITDTISPVSPLTVDKDESYLNVRKVELAAESPNLYVNSSGAEGDGYIYFYDGGSAIGQYIMWDDSETKFLFSGTISTDSTFANQAQFKSSNDTRTDIKILNTGLGDSLIFFDAANGDLQGGDYAHIGQNNDLDLILHLEANAGRVKLTQNAIAWDDLRIVPGAFQVAGNNDPTLADWDPGTSPGAIVHKVYKFQKNDEVFFTCQLPHTYKVGTDIKPHLHWTPCDRGNEESGNTVAWKLDYTWGNINGIFGNSGTLDLSDTCSGVDHKHELTPSGTIDGTGMNISSMMVCRLYRDTTSDTWVGTTAALSPAILEFDIHFQIDGFGSNTELTKD